MGKISPKISGLCGILAPVVIFIFLTISILIHPWFSWPDNALSDLGAVDSSYKMVFNSGLIIGGIMGILFVLGLPGLLRGRLGLAGSATVGVGMISLAMIGIFPEGTSPHMALSVAFYSLAAGGMLMVGADQLLDPAGRGWGIFVLATVFLSLAAIGLIATIPYELGAAIPEAIGAIAISEFSVVFGGRLLDFI